MDLPGFPSSLAFFVFDLAGFSSSLDFAGVSSSSGLPDDCERALAFPVFFFDSLAGLSRGLALAYPDSDSGFVLGGVDVPIKSSRDDLTGDGSESSDGVGEIVLDTA